jgi:hypothetical protein
MALQSSDLPEPVKRELLNQIRDQVGYSNYDRAVSAIGEDGVVDAVLSQVSSSRGSTASRSGSGSSSSVWDLFLQYGIYLVLFLSMLGPIGTTISTIVFIVLVASWVVTLCYRDFSTVAAGVVGIIALGGVGLLLWKVVPWVWHGAGQWWGWLGAHFR